MNLAFLTNEYPHIKVGKSGGIGTSIRNLAQSYVKSGNTVFVFVMHKNFEEFKDGGINVIPVWNNITTRGLLGVYLKSKEIQKKINKYIVENDIKYIEIPDWCGIAAFMNFKCKSVIKYNGTDAYFCFLEGRKQRLKNYFYEYLNIKKADIHIFVSNFAAKVTKEIFKINNKQFYVLPNAINLDNFIPFEFNSTPSSGIYTILYLGTLIRKKGCLEIPHIFNQVQKSKTNTRLLIVGNDTSDILTGSKSTWDIMTPLFNDITKVSYVGPLAYEDIRKIIADADVCIYPSFAEALPMTWLEAMAMYKAIVVSDIGWASEIVEDGKSGFLVNPKDHTKYADKILQLISNPALRQSMGISARKRIEDNFNIDKIAKKHIELFNNL